LILTLILNFDFDWYSCIYLFRCVQAERFSNAFTQGNCEYFATLETAAACPVQSSVVNLTACSLTDPGTGVTYSLLPMKTANNSHFVVAVGERSLEVTVEMTC